MNFCHCFAKENYFHPLKKCTNFIAFGLDRQKNMKPIMIKDMNKNYPSCRGACSSLL